MKKSFIVIGLGRFGNRVVNTLASLKADVIAIDKDEIPVSRVADLGVHCAICDSTNINALKELGVNNVDHAIVAIGNNLQASILTTINLSELGVSKITVRVDENTYVPVMKRIGATDVIIPEEASAIALANQIISDNIMDYYQVGKKFAIVQIKVKGDFSDITLADMDARNKYDITIIGIHRGGDFILPKGTDKVMKDDIVLVLGQSQQISKFETFLNE